MAPCLDRIRALCITVVVCGAASGWAPVYAVPSYDAVKQGFKSSETVLLDRQGEALQRLRTDTRVRRGEWVSLPEVSSALRNALILSEDKRFYAHSGVDWQAVSAAAWGNLWHQKTRGASTITMQLAGLLSANEKNGAGRRSFGQKIGQGIAAQWLEKNWRKDQILEAYLNLVPFRGELVGISAMSQTLFGKVPHGLNEQEAAIAAALVRAPNASPTLVVKRACSILKSMQPVGTPANNAANAGSHQNSASQRGTEKTSDKAAEKNRCEGLSFTTPMVLQNKSFAPSAGIAPHFMQQWLRIHPPKPAGQSAALRTPLRAPLQRFVRQSLQRQLRELQGRHVEDGAALVLDNATGEVLAWVGSSGALSSAAEVDGVLALRQAGSTLKPFLYAQAIAERRLTAASLLDDSLANIATTSGLYIPQNYDHQFRGWISVRTALAASLNLPAVRTLMMVSPRSFHRQLKALGLPLQASGDYYGYSLALGSADVSLLTLTNAYRALSNLGQYSPVSFQLGQTTPRQNVLDAQASFIVSDILSDTNARARTFGTDSILATRFWSAVKTGTSKDMRDNWALGYSERYTVGVWVGNAKGSPMWNVSGTSGAAPVWAEVMRYLHQQEPSRPPKPPEGLVQRPTQFANAIEASRAEWYLPGTELTRVQPRDATPDLHLRNGGRKSSAQTVASANSQGTRIIMPTSGTIVALDPDIPPKHQRLEFVADGAQVSWRMDQKIVARGQRFYWLPWPGKHLVQLLGKQGEVLDEIRLEVRGAGVKAEAKMPAALTAQRR